MVSLDRAVATCAAIAATIGLFEVLDSPAYAQDPPVCPDPTPTAVAVTSVPIEVTSTPADYFVLYVSHEVDADTTVEIPVLVKRGEAGTTTLTENIEALPAEGYRVEKYLITDPADVDGDCIDDITELDDYGNKNPVNFAASLALNDGAVTIPDHNTFEGLSYRGDDVLIDHHLKGLEFVKFFITRIGFCQASRLLHEYGYASESLPFCLACRLLIQRWDARRDYLSP